MDPDIIHMHQKKDKLTYDSYENNNDGNKEIPRQVVAKWDKSKRNLNFPCFIIPIFGRFQELNEATNLKIKNAHSTKSIFYHMTTNIILTRKLKMGKLTETLGYN